MRSSLQPSRRFCLARSSRAPISFEAATAVAQARGAIQDRLAHSLPVAAIQPSPRNPRQKVDGIAELADSLRTHGLLQPVVVRRRGAGYELIAGHRRLEAARVLGWTEIAAVVRDETDDQAYILTLVENLQREDLTADEEAEALGALVRERKWSVRKVAEAIKRDHLYVSRRLRVFEDPVLRQPVLEQRMPVSTAEVLLRVPPEERAALVDEALANDWGQMDVRRALRDRRAAAPRQTPQWGVTPHPDRSTYLVNLLAEVRAVLEAGVADLSPKARRDLQATYQRLALLVTG
jgi:ParB family transcriptional regulator, chromosome partitioning protein